MPLPPRYSFPTTRPTVAATPVQGHQQTLPVLVCCYGDYPEISVRTIQAMVDLAADPKSLRLHVGMNDCGKRTVDALRAFADAGFITTLIESKPNLNKDPIMRMLIDVVQEPYFVWFDDDSYPVAKGWDKTFLNYINTARKFAVAGSIHQTAPNRAVFDGYLDFLAKRPWFQGMDKFPPAQREIASFPLGSCWVADTAFMRKHNFPDRGMLKRYDDILLGDCVVQSGEYLGEVHGVWGPVIALNTGERRGTGETIETGWKQVDPTTGF